MAGLENTGYTLTAKLKGIFSKPAVDSDNQPYEKVSMRVSFAEKGDPDDPMSTYIRVPKHHTLPDGLEPGQVLNFPVRISLFEGKMYVNLLTHTPITPA